MDIDTACEVAQLSHELSEAFESLSDEQKNLTEICDVMDSLHESLDYIAAVKQPGVEMLNISGSLESLLQVPAKLITAEQAQEGLGEAAKELWERFKTICNRVRDIILGVIAKIVAFFMGQERQNKTFVAAVDAKTDTEVNDALQAAPVSKDAVTGNETFMSEAFLTKNIISPTTAEKLFALNSDAVSTAIGKMKVLETEFQSKINANQEAIKGYTDTTIATLKNGDGDGDNFFAIGWNKGTIKKFVADFNEVERIAKGRLNEFEALRRDYEAAEVAFRGVYINEDDAYKNDKLRLVNLVVSSNMSDVRWFTKMVSDSMLILVKCRGALERALKLGKVS